MDIARYFYYSNGALFWRENRGANRVCGTRAGRVSSKGYRRVKVCGESCAEHRVIFYIHHGYCPDQVDHINGIRDDNRIENLRAADNSRNQMNAAKPLNNTSGVKGVVWSDARKKYHSRIQADGARTHLGSFDTILDAAAAAISARNKIHGEWARL